MKTTLHASDVLRDIEFELLQGIVSREKLGQGIQALRNHQNLLRRTLLEPASSVTDARDAATRQLQLNDMLITLLQEMVAATEGLETKFKSLNSLFAAVSRAEASAEGEERFPEPQEEDAVERPQADLSLMVQPEKLQGEMVLARLPIPFIGGLVRRLQTALHRIVLFYVHRLGVKQGEVNVVGGVWITYLEQVQRYQLAEIDRLQTLVLSQEMRLARMEKLIATLPNSASERVRKV